MRSPFTYHRPASPRQAIEMKSRYGARARFWAGGTDMMLSWRAGAVDFDHCIDLTFLNDAKAIAVDDEEIRIGALVTLDALDRATDTNQLLRVLAETARLMCTPQTRTIATIGGNICHAAPSADLSAVLVAMDAQVKILGPAGKRELPLEDFFLGVNATALGDDEMLLAIKVPLPAARREASYRRVARTVVDIALVGSSVSITATHDGVIGDARVVLGAVAPVPIRSAAAEAVLLGGRIRGLEKRVLEQAGRAAADDSRPISDVRATEAYRRHMCNVLTQRAVEDCIGKLGGQMA